MRSLVDRGWKRCSGLSGWFAVLPIVSGLLLAAPALSVDAATVRAPLTSAVSTSSDSWLMLPMGELSDPSNTFWQLLHAAPGSSHWSVVTPEGVADNGGLLVGTSGGSAVVGFLPSQLLHYSPLAQSIDGGATWSPQLLPAGLTARPDALAYSAGGALALIVGHKVLSAPPSLSRWSLLVTASRLARSFVGCGVTAIDAVAILPTGSPLVATGCRKGVVGIFTKQARSLEVRTGQRRAPCPARPPMCSGCKPPARRWRRSRRRPGVGGEPWSPCGARVAHRGRRRHPSLCPAGHRFWPVPSGRVATMAVVLRSHKGGVTAYSLAPDGVWVPSRPAAGRHHGHRPAERLREHRRPRHRRLHGARRVAGCLRTQSARVPVGPGAVQTDRHPVRLVGLAARATVAPIPAAEGTAQ